MTASLEALWTVEFIVAGGMVNGGVLVFEAGRALGGDSQHYYVGTYEARDDVLRGQARITHYHGPLSTAWGTDERDFVVEFKAKRYGDTIIRGEMWRPQAPGLRLAFRATRCADLP
jgi:hypothetical protein